MYNYIFKPEMPFSDIKIKIFTNKLGS